jgi:FkbM family methyltransferase
MAVSNQQTQMQSTPVKILDQTYDVFGYPNEGWFNILSQTGVYEEFNLNNLRPFIKPDSVCIDAGAFLGAMTLAMAQLAPHGKVYAFEPDPKSYAALQCTLNGANGTKNVVASPWTLGKRGARGCFVEDPAWRSSSHFVPGNGYLSTHAIDELDLQRVDLIKIDVEGAEMDVLDGAMETLARCKPVVIMEFNTFAFVHYRGLIPRIALGCICEIFPWVGYFEKRVGRLIKLDDREAFLRNNFLGGFVDDLVCLTDAG